MQMVGLGCGKEDPVDAARDQIAKPEARAGAEGPEDFVIVSSSSASVSGPSLRAARRSMSTI